MKLTIPKLTAVPITAKDYAVSAVCIVRFGAACWVARVYLKGCKPPEVACGRHCGCCCGADELWLVVLRRVVLLQEERKRERGQRQRQSANVIINSDDGTTTFVCM